MTYPKVTITWWPDRPAELIRRGPQVSEIRWLDNRVGMATCYVSNDQIKGERNDQS